MSVEIDPAELGFRRPFTVEAAQVLKIKNPNSAPVAFKVKTTAPKQYCVRPNSGRIEPGHEVEVSVLLQSMKQEPAPDARCRDKFLVQSVAITGDNEFTNVAQIWDSVEKSAIQERKIRVVWLSASDEGSHSEAVTPTRKPLTNGAHVDATPDAPPPAYSSPHDESTIVAETPAPEQSEVVVKKAEPKKEPKKEIKKEPKTEPVAESSVSAAAATVKAAATSTVEELKEQLAQAQATIARLNSEAASGLRQRKQVVEEKVAALPQLAQVERQGTEGVPVQIVAALCFVSFLLAYIFF